MINRLISRLKIAKDTFALDSLLPRLTLGPSIRLVMFRFAKDPFYVRRS